MSHNGQWLDAGIDALKRRSGGASSGWHSTNSTDSVEKALRKALPF
jgi:hypothetical protein